MTQSYICSYIRLWFYGRPGVGSCSFLIVSDGVSKNARLSDSPFMSATGRERLGGLLKYYEREAA